MSDSIPAQVEPPVESEAPSAPKKDIVKPAHRAILAHMTQGKTITEAMIAMSYAPSTVEKPHLITNSKSWQALMREHLPEDLVAERHAELLNKRDIEIHTYGRGKNRKHEVIDRGPNVPAVSKALEMAYKLRGAFKSDAPPPPGQTVYNLFYQPHIQARVRAFEDAIKDSIAHEIVATDTGASESDAQPAAATTGEPDAGATA